MANPLDYLKNLIPEDTNIFGASPDSNLKQLASLGLLGDEAGYKKALEDANRQSIFQGLLNTGLSYVAQPKTGNYGTVLPYVAKAGMAGMAAAQKPFDKLASNAMTNAQLKALLAKQNESIFAKESQSKYTPESVQESIKIKQAGGSDADARAVLVNLPDTPDGSNILKTTYFAKNKKTGEMYPIHFNKLKKVPNRAVVNGESVPVSKDMFGDDGMTYINIGQEGKFTKSIDKMDELEIEINNEDTAILDLADYIKTAGDLPSGLPKLANQASEAIKTFFNVNASEFTEEELMQRLQEGRMQGLLGRLRVETVGGGVMTEQDAYRIVQKLGGDPKTAFNNPARVQKAIGEVMASKYKLYAKKVKQYNDQISRGFGAMGKQTITPIQIDEDLFFGANKDSAIEAMTGSPATENKTQTTTTNTGLSISEQAKREKERRRKGGAN